MRKNAKTKWLDAVRATIERYENHPVCNRMSDCPFCAAALAASKLPDIASIGVCGHCIQKSDEPSAYDGKVRNELYCLGMRTYPRGFTYVRRIAYWERALAVLEKLPAYRFEPAVIARAVRAFPEIWETDDSTYNE